MEDQKSYITVSYDIGGLLGSIALGLISDRFFSKRSPVAFIACMISALASFGVTFGVNYMQGMVGLVTSLMLFYSFFIAGLSNLVSSSCSADLAKASQLNGQTNGAATIMGIIQGCGTLGSAFSSLIIGFTLDLTNNDWILGMWLEISIVITIACLPLSYLAYRDTLMIHMIRASIRILSKNM